LVLLLNCCRLYGSYKNLEGGLINEALEDLCGGLSEFYSAKIPELYEIMEMSYRRSSFMGCSITVCNKVPYDEKYS
jgi:calpain